MQTVAAHAQFQVTISDRREVDMSRVPVLTILGSTGCGKSRLGIELARRFSGEIISADSMQVYKGLNIITAKVTEEEKKMAPHHMLDILDPLKHNYTVINDLHARKKLPIIVGGTNYYIESILWEVLIDKIQIEKDDQLGGENVPCSKKMKVELDRSTTKTNEQLYEELVRVDPEMAKRFHPNNRRKIIRSLEVFEQYGVKHSELLKAQRTAGGSGLGGPLRHQNSILLWLRCDVKVLEERLDSRVDAMVETGLVQELLDFHQRYNEQRIKSNTSADYTKGIFQSIGFKEFHAYLVLPEDEKQEKKGQELLQKGIDDLKLVTKRYARRQEKWIRNRLVRRSDRQVPPIYTLDCTDLDQWNSCVYEPAVAIIEAVLRGEKPTQKPLNETVENEKFTDSSNEERHYCDICDRIFIGHDQWNVHMGSTKHERTLRKKKRLEELKKLEERKESEEQEKFEEKEELIEQRIEGNQ
ncbi:tRNA dimethylallyltransferase isoform X2 [Bombus pyrosoma]|uniref:tRNA dimethylallyltransferase isoform X2 n=1 Tax=Bombus pyrosoma TaxID=396416 RepID=UPI001CB994F6|nr:tRNA dimethylallyltransferase isoform X2 [Bombus pyrosoma]